MSLVPLHPVHDDEELRAAAAIERSVIGKVIADSSTLEALPVLERDFFRDPKNESVWTAILNLYGESQPIDAPSVDSELARIGRLAAVGGIGSGMMWMLDGMGITRESAIHHATAIRQRGLQKRLQYRTSELLARARREDMNVGDVVAEMRALADGFDGETPTAATSTNIVWRAPSLASEIERRSAMPWIDLRLGESVVVSARLGMVVALTAQTGGGKSSLAIDVSADHARHVGPVIYISAELDADVVAGRAVGQAIGAAWADVLSLNGVTAARVAHVLADLKRLIILDGDRATLTHAEQAIATMRAEHPGAPVLVVADYVQVLPGEGREERVRVANIAESIRRMAQRLGVVVLAVSQTSRASSKGLRDGELVGADTTTTGAESSQIERMASVTIAIGGLKEREDGRSDVDLSIGKSRFGGGDKVLPAIYDGRTGRWTITGPAVSGAEKRAERSQEKDGKRQETAALAIVAKLEKSTAPMARAELVSSLGLRRADVIAAVRDLIADPDSPVVEVKGKRAGPAWPVWMRHHADAGGIDIVPASIGGRA